MDLPPVYDTLPPFDPTADLPWTAPQSGMVAIYGLFTPDGLYLRYIGKTSEPHERHNDHCALKQGDRSRKTGWLLALRDCGMRPVLRVLAWVISEQWIAVERAYIAEARRMGALLLNETRGGPGADGYEESYGHKYKRSLVMLGNTYGQEYWTPERRAERSAAYTARRDEIAERTRQAMAQPDTKERFLAAVRATWTPERRRAHGALNRGRKASDETRAKMSAVRRGRKLSAAHCAAIKASWVKRKQRAAQLKQEKAEP